MSKNPCAECEYRDCVGSQTEGGLVHPACRDCARRAWRYIAELQQLVEKSKRLLDVPGKPWEAVRLLRDEAARIAKRRKAKAING